MTSRSDTPVLLRGVSKRYGSTTAVDGLDLEVGGPRCSRCSGPNGAGKTTTVEMCEGFIRPDAGTIEILGLDPVADNARLRERIGVMLQGGGGYPAARAGEMLNLVAAYSANPLDPAWLMDTLGLTESARTTYRRLSGGQQQRLALACAVVGRPELVFLDEPTAGMDAHARIVVWELIDGLRRDGVTVVLTTHQLTEAEQLADRLVIIDHGVAVATGTPAELMQRGAENQLRFTAPPKLDLSLLISALPESYQAIETMPGEYLVEGHIDPQVLATVTAWCARLDVLATDMRVEQRSLEDVFLDLTGRELAIVTESLRPGTFTPDPRPATVPTMLAAQFGLELKLLLRNGEQLLLTMFIPITLLVGLTLLPLGSFGTNRAATFVPAIMALAVISTAFTGQAIAVAFDRRYGALKRLGATALPGVGHHRGQVACRRHRGVPAVDSVGRHRLCAGLAPGDRRAGVGRGDHRARHRRVRRAGPAARRHAAGRDRAGGGQPAVVRLRRARRADARAAAWSRTARSGWPG